MKSKHKLSGHFISLQRETRKYNRKRGLYSYVARLLGVTPAHVRNVAMGLRRSQSVEAALMRELPSFLAQKAEEAA